MRKALLLPLFCLAVSFASGYTEGDDRPPPGGNAPLTRDRLVGTKLDHHRLSPSVEWHFKDKTFVLISHKPPLPADLTKAILGEKSPAAKIEGKWNLDETKGELILKDIKADGKKSKDKASLRIQPLGAARVDIIGLQYNIFPGGAQESP